MKTFRFGIFLISVVFLPSQVTWADNTVQANRDTWIADNTPGTNFEGSVNPSAQLRNDATVRRISFYEFTLPKVGPHETVTGVDFRIEDFFAPSSFRADFGLLNGVPNLATITYNSAISDGYVAAGNDSNQNPVIGPNTTLAGDAWTVSNGSGTLKFTDNDASDGLAQLVKNATGVTAQTRTLMLTPVDTAPSATIGGFYGEENGESTIFFPNPRLTVRKELTNVTHEIQANADVWIASNTPDTNFEGGVNPSTQLRNHSTVTRASLYSFTLPQLSAGQSIQGAQFDLVQNFDGGHFSADFALLASNPDLSAITWNSAISDGFISGLDGSFNPIFGAAATGAGELWELFGDDADSQRFTDGDASNGLAKLIADAASTAGPVDITLLLVSRGQEDLALAGFYGAENGEGGDFFPHPRLRLTVSGATLDGDLTGDGFVGQDDLNIILGNWGQNVTQGDRMEGDPSNDGFVGQDDLNFVLGDWGQSIPLATGSLTSVPEPQAILLAVVAAGLFVICATTRNSSFRSTST